MSENEGEGDTFNDEYSWCPRCGQPIHDGECDEYIVNTRCKPYFSTGDLRNYKEEFLIDIIKWYEERCRILEKEQTVKSTMRNLCIHAIEWWKMRKPCAWTYATYMKNPQVNQPNDVDKDLALSVIEYIEACNNDSPHKIELDDDEQ